ncbi:Blue copper protein [Nymphaea thermarum]|nr:Blue copper protein [Nymphaea thermarum]
MALVKLVALAFLLAVPISATDYTVGDTSGWTLGVDYNNWVSGKTFQVGDRLVFTYGSTHTVDEVNQASYASCSSSSPISSATDGNTTITLNTAGTHYFICAISGHCQQNMKVQIPVTGSAAGSPSGSPSTPSPPSAQSMGVSLTSYSMSSMVMAVSSVVVVALGLGC